MFISKGYSRPLPELLDGDDWEARNSGDLTVAYVNFKKKEFVVPFQGGPAGELVRAHEAMHVKISPRTHTYSEADFPTYQSVEDTRVNQGLRLAGITTNRGRVFKKEDIVVALTDPQCSTPLKLGEAYFATKGLEEEKDVRDLIEKLNPHRPELLDICDSLYEKYFNKNEEEGFLTSDQERDDCVLELKTLLEEISTPEEKQQDKENRGNKRGKNITEAWQPGATEYMESMELPTITAEEMEEIKNALPHEINYHGSHDPGTITVQKVKFDSFLKFKKVKSVKSAASDEGVIPSRMHRYATDMRVFSRKGRRRANSAVLIDVSGSMALSEKDVVNICKLSPQGTIAVYSGRSDSGTLRIIAEGGKFYSKTRQGMGGGNVVDLPAVQWLAARPEKKKLWISDGQITGCNDGRLKEIHIRKIVKIIRDSGIVRIGNVRELMKSGTLIDGRFDHGKEIDERLTARVVDSKGKTHSFSSSEDY